MRRTLGLALLIAFTWTGLDAVQLFDSHEDTFGGLILAQGVPDFDVVIVNGRVIDPESGLDVVRSVGIRGGSIAAVELGPLRGRTTIDATGHVVAPGFVDLHRHGQNDENYRYAALDGVTSVFELEVGTPDVEAWYREREPGRLVNYGVAIGHIGVRMAVLGDTGDFCRVVRAPARWRPRRRSRKWRGGSMRAYGVAR